MEEVVKLESTNSPDFERSTESFFMVVDNFNSASNEPGLKLGFDSEVTVKNEIFFEDIQENSKNYDEDGKSFTKHFVNGNGTTLDQKSFSKYCTDTPIKMESECEEHVPDVIQESEISIVDVKGEQFVDEKETIKDLESSLKQFFPVYDPVCILIETPFARWEEHDKKHILACENPTPHLDVSKITKWRDKNCTRKFKMHWYSQCNWLCGSYYLQKLFCLPCILMSSKTGVWNSSGFCDFGNVSRSLQKHESSAEHLRCAVRCKKLRLSTNTMQRAIQENSRLFIQQYNDKVLLNRRYMNLPIRAVIYLSKQELAFRSNFEELLADYIAVSPADIQEHHKKIAPVFSAHSNTVQNELIECISEYIHSFIEKEIKECDFISIQVDDVTDICQKSKCSIIFRYVVPGGIVKERFLGFFDVSPDRSADTIFGIVLGCLDKYDCRSKLVGQCFNGASVMTGHLCELKAKIKEISPQAVLMHSFGHRLTSVLQQSCYNILGCRKFFARISAFSAFFRYCAKRSHEADSVLGRRLPSEVVARWSSFSRILSNINNEWEYLKDVCAGIVNDDSGDQVTLRQCEGFLKHFTDFEFAILVGIFGDIFAPVDVLFEVLQQKSLDIIKCITHINQFQELIKKKRNEDYFKLLFDLALARVLPSGQQGPTRVTYAGDIFNKYKDLFYEILDNVSMQITTRFEDAEKMKFFTLLDLNNFKKFPKDFPMDKLQNLKEYHPNVFADVKLYRLKGELDFIYSNEKYANVKDPQDLLKILSEDTDIFKESYKLFSLILTIPSTCASHERSPCIKRIKNYLCNARGEDKLSNLARISIEKDLLCELLTTQPFYDDIVNRFASLKDRSIDLILKT